uniref:Uncharacterized protein n=1 Tax=Cryptococcus bacillisporus CA1280 TaxID=1296109 RepID=A0A0D0VLG4_CRYGA|nr:hypothetical protein I312_02713 [Cryptococcus bacillisporus CA1280]
MKNFQSSSPNCPTSALIRTTILLQTCSKRSERPLSKICPFHHSVPHHSKHFCQRQAWPLVSRLYDPLTFPPLHSPIRTFSRLWPSFQVSSSSTCLPVLSLTLSLKALLAGRQVQTKRICVQI